MNFAILTPTASPTVAVGIDTLGIAGTLQSSGHQVTLFAGELPEPAVLPAGAILIYQHAIGWPAALRLLRSSNRPSVVRHHGITPASYMKPFSGLAASACMLGTGATRQLARSSQHRFWVNSDYNRSELIQYGAPAERCAVLPPFHAIEEIAAEPADAAPAALYGGARSRLLCVGAMRPHKGQLRALRILAHYRAGYDPGAVMILAGGTDEGLEAYVQTVRNAIVSLGLERSVAMAENVTRAQLHGLYRAANVLLCVSEHEGFGVPLVEANYFGVPVVAWARTAVPETVGDAGVLVSDDDEACFAAAIRDVVEDSRLAAALAEAGRRRYASHFQPRVLAERLAVLVRELPLSE